MTNHCGYCGDPIPEGAVSDYFCCSAHQDLWYLLPALSWQRDRAMQNVTAALTGLTEAMDQIGSAIAEASAAFTRLGDQGQPT